MQPSRNDIEKDMEPQEWILSMRVKVTVGSLCFLVVVSSLFLADIPEISKAVRGLGQAKTLTENESQPPEQDNQTIFYEGFDTDQPQTTWDLMHVGTVNVRDGYAFLNVTGATKETNSYAVMYCTLDAWLYASLEIRLRCSDDNKLNTDIGGGVRYWGLNYEILQLAPYAWDTSIHIQTWSPEAGSLAGFRGDVAMDSNHVYSTDLSDIDIREWHVYTILWEPDGVTFMVDGEVAGTTDQSPSAPMWSIVTLWNLIGAEPVGPDEGRPKMALEDAWLQVDYIKLFASKERFEAWSEEISPLVANATGIIERLEEKDFPSQKAREDLAADWQEGNYNYQAAKLHLEELTDSLHSCLDHLDEVNAMFSQASECIENLTEKGDTRNENMCKAYYTNAEGAWEEYDYELTRNTLSNIIAKCPEPTLLPILSLILLPALLRRRERDG